MLFILYPSDASPLVAKLREYLLQSHGLELYGATIDGLDDRNVRRQFDSSIVLVAVTTRALIQSSEFVEFMSSVVGHGRFIVPVVVNDSARRPMASLLKAWNPIEVRSARTSDGEIQKIGRRVAELIQPFRRRLPESRSVDAKSEVSDAGRGGRDRDSPTGHGGSRNAADQESGTSALGGGASGISGSGGLSAGERPETRDAVRFAAFAPRSVAPRTSCLVDIWAYANDQREQVLERALRSDTRAEVGNRGPIELGRSTPLEVVVEIADFRFRSQPEPLLWTGDAANVSFAVKVPQSARMGAVLGSARIAHGGVRVATLQFELSVGSGTARPDEIGVREERVRSIFASYANEDRGEALRVRRALEPLQVDVFVDALSLRMGVHWADELEHEIASRDRFYLLWSTHAARSEWVEKEWRCALATRGLDFIDPVALADPRDVPPPKELAVLHFFSSTVAAMDYEARRARPPSRTDEDDR